jgi:hypothetical protein
VVTMVWLVVLVSVGKLHHRGNLSIVYFMMKIVMITSIVILIPEFVQIFVCFNIAHIFSCFINLPLDL